jgi:hypothetical protein
MIHETILVSGKFNQAKGTDMAAATIKQVMAFFGESVVAKFTREWKDMTDADKNQIKGGIGDGTLTY